MQYTERDDQVSEKVGFASFDPDDMFVCPKCKRAMIKEQWERHEDHCFPEMDQDWIDCHKDGKCADCGVAFGDPERTLSDQDGNMPFLCRRCAPKRDGGY